MREKLGQHFLKNKSAINKIIAALDIKTGETVIEIGPGEGALTFPLAEECAAKNSGLIAIEKDETLAQELKQKFDKNGAIKIITGDVLEVLPTFSINLKTKIAGNIPYYITGKLLRTISELENKPALAVLMVQKEVAERIAANPPKMNLLAAATQFWSKPEIIMKLKPGDFDPPPEVDSAVIKLTTKSAIASEAKQSIGYYKLIRIIFKQPRKTLINNLKEGVNMPKTGLENALKTAGLPLNCRPQNLSLENIINLLCFFKDYIV